MGLSDSRPRRRDGYVFPSRVARFRSLPGRVSQAPRLICPHALSPTTPEGPLAACACCFAIGLSGFTLVGRLATFVFLSRPNRVHLHYGSRVRLPTRQLHYRSPRSFGYTLNRQFTW